MADSVQFGVARVAEFKVHVLAGQTTTPVARIADVGSLGDCYGVVSEIRGIALAHKTQQLCSGLIIEFRAASKAKQLTPVASLSNIQKIHNVLGFVGPCDIPCVVPTKNKRNEWTEITCFHAVIFVEKGKDSK
jgi:hypothetical protein